MLSNFDRLIDVYLTIDFWVLKSNLHRNLCPSSKSENDFFLGHLNFGSLNAFYLTIDFWVLTSTCAEISSTCRNQKNWFLHVLSNFDRLIDVYLTIDNGLDFLVDLFNFS